MEALQGHTKNEVQYPLTTYEGGNYGVLGVQKTTKLKQIESTIANLIKQDEIKITEEAFLNKLKEKFIQIDKLEKNMLQENYDIGEAINQYYKKDYGKNVNKRIAESLNKSVDTIYKLRQFATKYNQANIEQLSDGTFQMPYHIIKRNLDFGPIDLIKIYLASSSKRDFLEKITNNKANTKNTNYQIYAEGINFKKEKMKNQDSEKIDFKQNLIPKDDLKPELINQVAIIEASKPQTMMEMLSKPNHNPVKSTKTQDTKSKIQTKEYVEGLKKENIYLMDDIAKLKGIIKKLALKKLEYIKENKELKNKLAVLEVKNN